MYVAAAAAVLGCYTKTVIDRVTDPRTGVPSDLKFLPAVAEIREACDRAAILIDRMAEPKRRAYRFEPPPLKPGEIDSTMHAKMVEEGKATLRPVGKFERPDDEWNRGTHLMPAASSELKKFDLMAVNRTAFERECASAGIDPSRNVSPSLLKILHVSQGE